MEVERCMSHLRGYKVNYFSSFNSLSFFLLSFLNMIEKYIKCNFSECVKPK